MKNTKSRKFKSNIMNLLYPLTFFIVVIIIVSGFLVQNGHINPGEFFQILLSSISAIISAGAMIISVFYSIQAKETALADQRIDIMFSVEDVSKKIFPSDKYSPLMNVGDNQCKLDRKTEFRFKNSLSKTYSAFEEFKVKAFDLMESQRRCSKAISEARLPNTLESLLFHFSFSNLLTIDEVAATTKLNPAIWEQRKNEVEEILRSLSNIFIEGNKLIEEKNNLFVMIETEVKSHLPRNE